MSFPNTKSAETMYQVNFSKQCMRFLNSLPKIKQLELVDLISGLTEARLQKPSGDLGKFHRDGHTIYRMRADEYRVYFELSDDSIYCHYILDKNTLTDFIFRCKLPVSDEQMFEQHKSFWKYIETLGKKS
jgi:mRNA-degrading endonuclease RelE of RelBE toxin-antitoxin system